MSSQLSTQLSLRQDHQETGASRRSRWSKKTEEIQEATVTLAAAKKIRIDTTVAAVLSPLRCI